MNKTTVVNIYNFVRRAHEEPGRFIQDDFDTIARQMELLKQLGLPSTYALKHDALLDPAYQRLFLEQTEEGDEIAAWWEITGELCRRAGVPFGGSRGEVYDDRVGTAYSLGYTPEERRKLLDAYMKDFKEVFGYYPKTIGSWVIDIETFRYAREAYGVAGGALCRDQIGTDGFTLWGGYVNGAYYPSLKNEMVPAQTPEGQLDLPIFRLLGPDPVYSFEEGFQEGVSGVYSLEPSCVVGRQEGWVTWMFERLTEEDSIGMSYAQVGQENNFLWENIEPGFALQLQKLQKLSREGRLRIETMAETAEWFAGQYRMTPPSSFQASRDWDEERGLQTLWYCSKYYRVSFLKERETLFIRDWFLYREAYPSRYLEEPLRETGSVFDALPLVYGPAWKGQDADGKVRPRPAALLTDEKGNLLRGVEKDQKARFRAVSEGEMEVHWETAQGTVKIFLREAEMEIQGGSLRFTCLPVWESIGEKQLRLRWQGFPYILEAAEGSLRQTADGQICLEAANGVLRLRMDCEETAAPQAKAAEKDSWRRLDASGDMAHQKPYVPRYLRMQSRTDRQFPAASPRFPGGDRAGIQGEEILVSIEGEGEIYYTLDGREPDRQSLRYQTPFAVCRDTEIRARSYREGFLESREAACRIFFGLPVEKIVSRGDFDPRPVFNRRGAWDLLDGRRGSLDYQDGRWLGTQEDLDVTLTLQESCLIETVRIGFLSHHRSGILYPACVELWIGEDAEKLEPAGRIELPDQPGKREIEKKDVVFSCGKQGSVLRIAAKNRKIQPDWACYHGLPGAFLMADSILLTGEKV